jgi:hypothetical protein
MSVEIQEALAILKVLNLNILISNGIFQVGKKEDFSI